MADDLKADFVAVRRAFMRGGRAGALAELIRRLPEIGEPFADGVLNHVLTSPVTASDRAGSC